MSARASVQKKNRIKNWKRSLRSKAEDPKVVNRRKQIANCAEYIREMPAEKIGAWVGSQKLTWRQKRNLIEDERQRRRDIESRIIMDKAILDRLDRIVEAEEDGIL